MVSFHRALYFLRWQLYPVVLALPAHATFVMRGRRRARTSISKRLVLAWYCAGIHLRLRCGHNPQEALHIIEEIIELAPEMPGIVLECGTFLGGSTAKLSRAATMSNRQMIVCDSFEGLPAVTAGDHSDIKPDFREGEYAGRLEDVKRNVERFGDGTRVRYVQGWYEESLEQLRGTPIACAFWDVDLQESFRSCITKLWAELTPGAKVFLHDIDRAPVVAVFTDAEWWECTLGVGPPLLVGAHRGLGRLSPLLGYVTKGVTESRRSPQVVGV